MGGGGGGSGGAIKLSATTINTGPNSKMEAKGGSGGQGQNSPGRNSNGFILSLLLCIISSKCYHFNTYFCNYLISLQDMVEGEVEEELL